MSPSPSLRGDLRVASTHVLLFLLLVCFFVGCRGRDLYFQFRLRGNTRLFSSRIYFNPSPKLPKDPSEKARALKKHCDYEEEEEDKPIIF